MKRSLVTLIYFCGIEESKWPSKYIYTSYLNNRKEIFDLTKKNHHGTEPFIEHLLCVRGGARNFLCGFVFEPMTVPLVWWAYLHFVMRKLRFSIVHLLKVHLEISELKLVMTEPPDSHAEILSHPQVLHGTLSWRASLGSCCASDLSICICSLRFVLCTRTIKGVARVVWGEESLSLVCVCVKGSDPSLGGSTDKNANTSFHVEPMSSTEFE